LDAQEERLQHQEEVRAPKESLANVVSARKKIRKKVRNKWMMREEFRQLLQQVHISNVF
jgi:hypothetical protein